MGITIHPMNNEIQFVMEFMKNGSLFDLLHSNFELSEQVAIRILLDVAKGLAYLHSLNIIHRGITSDNILV